MKIRIIQTADHTSGYKELMDVTREVNEAYCAKWGYDYKPYVGIKRGFHPWNATFNRIYLMEEECEKKEVDWVVYLDADCFVYNPDVRLEEIIFEENNSQMGFIFCKGSSDALYDINAGVFFMNVHNRFSSHVIRIWRDYYESILSEEILYKAVVPWSIHANGFYVQDQTILEHIFRMYQTLGTLHMFLKTYNGVYQNRFNYNGDFIRQLIRPHMGANGPCIEERIVDAKVQVQTALSKLKGGIVLQQAVQELHVSAPPPMPPAPLPPSSSPSSVSDHPIQKNEPTPKQEEDTPMLSSHDVTQSILMNCGGFISTGIMPP